eukprot:scaffold33285_cov12-Tisochrysis_lutea.AAC.1
MACSKPYAELWHHCPQQIMSPGTPSWPAANHEYRYAILARSNHGQISQAFQRCWRRDVDKKKRKDLRKATSQLPCSRKLSGQAALSRWDPTKH